MGFVAHVSNESAASISIVDHKDGGRRRIENFKDRHTIFFRTARNVNKYALTNWTAKLSFHAEEYENKYIANNL